MVDYYWGGKPIDIIWWLAISDRARHVPRLRQKAIRPQQMGADGQPNGLP